MGKKLILLLFICSPFFLHAQKTEKKLNAKLLSASNGFNGDLGIYVKNLRTGKVIMINADTVFPTASIVKVPIMVGIMDKIEKGENIIEESKNADAHNK